MSVYFVRLNKAFFKTNTTLEDFLVCFKKAPIYTLKSLLCLNLKKIRQKVEIATDDKIPSYPLNNELYKFLDDKDKKVYLVTNASFKKVDKIIEKYPIFRELPNSGKRSIHPSELEAFTNDIKEEEKVYIGAGFRDIKLWKKIGGFNTSSNPFLSLITKNLNIDTQFTSIYRFSNLLSLLRTSQWSKNATVLVPFFLSHSYNNFNSCMLAVLSFLSFSFASSSNYILNDLLDLDSDRRNFAKSKKIICRGDFSIELAFLISISLFIISISAAFYINIFTGISLLGFCIIANLYTFVLKHVVIIDILTLTILYFFRILYGSYSLEIPLSDYLLSFAFFIFFSLSSLKKFGELISIKHKGKGFQDCNYKYEDVYFLQTFGVAAGVTSIIAIYFYIKSPEAATIYKNLEFLKLLIPIYLCYLLRIWFKAGRGEVWEDPVLFSIRDIISILLMLLSVIIIIISTY